MDFTTGMLTVADATAAHEVAVTTLIEMQALLARVTPTLRGDIYANSNDHTDHEITDAPDITTAEAMLDAVVETQGKVDAAKTLQAQCLRMLTNLGIEASDLPEAVKGSHFDMARLAELSARLQDIKQAKAWWIKEAQTLEACKAHYTQQQSWGKLVKQARPKAMNALESSRLSMLVGAYEQAKAAYVDQQTKCQYAQDQYQRLIRQTPLTIITQAFADALDHTDHSLGDALAQHAKTVSELKLGLSKALAQAKQAAEQADTALEAAKAVTAVTSTHSAGGLQETPSVHTETSEPSVTATHYAASNKRKGLWAMVFGREETTAKTSKDDASPSAHQG